MVFNGSRREWTTHTTFPGKDASNLSYFPVSAQYLTAAHPPGMGVSFLAYTQPHANPTFGVPGAITQLWLCWGPRLRQRGILRWQHRQWGFLTHFKTIILVQIVTKVVKKKFRQFSQDTSCNYRSV